MRIAASLAQRGDAQAAAYLGEWINYWGDPKLPGVSGDAAYWYGKSAAGGSARGAMLYAAELDNEELGDPDKAARWYEIAWPALKREAKSGSADACRLLASAHYAGWGVPEDEAKSIEMLKRAAELGHLGAMFDLGLHLWDVPDRTEEQRQEAIRLWRHAADHGGIGAYHLGVQYAIDEDMPIDYAESLRYYGIAAENGNTEALYNIGVMHQIGEGTTKDVARGAAIIVRAAESGDSGAMFCLIRGYNYGYFGFPVDPEEAAHWQRRYDADRPRPES